jgi:hypothetical protein
MKNSARVASLWGAILSRDVWNIRQAYQPLDRDIQRRFVPLLRINHPSSLSVHYSPLSADWRIIEHAYGAEGGGGVRRGRKGERGGGVRSNFSK